jgi:hypothetical protein
MSQKKEINRLRTALFAFKISTKRINMEWREK